jgi:hypothetical protein
VLAAPVGKRNDGRHRRGGRYGPALASWKRTVLLVGFDTAGYRAAGPKANFSSLVGQADDEQSPAKRK